MMKQDNNIIIYSQNLGAYLRCHKVELYYKKDAWGKVFIYTTDTESTRKLIKEYKEDEELHSFLKAFKEIKTNIATATYNG